MRPIFLTISALALTAWLYSCVSAPQSEVDFPEGRLWGDYLVGSYANYIDDAPARAEAFGDAFRRDMDNVDLGHKAVTAAVTNGDIDGSRKLAVAVLKDAPDEPMARTVMGIQAFARGQDDRAYEFLNVKPSDLTYTVLMSFVESWVLADKGDIEAAEKNFNDIQTTFESVRGGVYFQAMAELMKAKLAAYNKDYDKALSILQGDKLMAYESLVGTVAPIETALTHARVLSDLGRIDDARTFLQKFNDDNNGFETGPVPVYLEVLGKGKPLNIHYTAQEEASRMLTDMSYGFFVPNQAIDVAEVYLRMALTLDPKNDKGLLWLGAILEDSDRHDEALRLYQAIPASSPLIVSAKLSEANVYFDQDEDDKAVAILEKTNREHESFITRESLGRAKLIREDYAEALPIYQKLVDSMTEAEIEANTQPLYFRGICYEREGMFDKAVEDFQHVLRIEPDNADALNYLGYTWVDRNENLTEAFEMINRAVELEPESGAIVDSLGWAHYKLGHYEQARLNLEKAVELTPYSATIIDHLGDVYWKLGRYREAGYQWKRALDYDPTDEELKSINIKLKDGLTPKAAEVSP